MVGIAQLVERRVVVADVAGSSPVTHPDGKAPWILRNLDPRGFSHVRTEVVPCRGVPTPRWSRTEVVASGVRCSSPVTVCALTSTCEQVCAANVDLVRSVACREPVTTIP